MNVNAIKKRLKESKPVELPGEDDDDDLDNFMANLDEQLPDKHKITAWKVNKIYLR